jgi:hypothetical protein
MGIPPGRWCYREKVTARAAGAARVVLAQRELTWRQ